MNRLILPSWYRKHLGLVAHACLALAVLALFVGVLQLRNDGEKAHTAICAFRSDLQQRAHDSRVFLFHHPDGVPGLATRADILTSIHNEQHTINALGVADC